ncbi:Phosphoribosyl-AMP cyclohydrolase [Desulfamplus magnetovallimortis]|uniref:Phosphoribosyl-AMP cyclohydrolase n=1 Tax=Desulfamplus magnetovallimortis TaxID=1246637 RepID=A0A1W1H9M6_9BACT|nr:phosphoribosyl-AMP cyclohydrolase [Desulfamplus magnetovallimortis]SLM29068.1 Phosphoribosyl-AMP cyclohydrolase [Desulfamplus magnetovallimortis]
MPEFDCEKPELAFKKTGGLLPAIAQDYLTGEVLMLAYMNEASWEETIKSGMATYYSRSRQKLWKKGETSGHMQVVKEIRIDCDNDTVLLKVDQIGGAACHEGYKSCFFRKVHDGESLVIVEKKVFDPEKVY